MPDTPDECNARYRVGLCIDCGLVPHSAGRPRCDNCHAATIPSYQPGLKPPRPRAAR